MNSLPSRQPVTLFTSQSHGTASQIKKKEKKKKSLSIGPRVVKSISLQEAHVIGLSTRNQLNSEVLEIVFANLAAKKFKRLYKNEKKAPR